MLLDFGAAESRCWYFNLPKIFRDRGVYCNTAAATSKNAIFKNNSGPCIVIYLLFQQFRLEFQSESVSLQLHSR